MSSSGLSLTSKAITFGTAGEEVPLSLTDTELTKLSREFGERRALQQAYSWFRCLHLPTLRGGWPQRSGGTRSRGHVLGIC